MANRVTDAEVRLIKPAPSIADLTPYIDAANCIVNELAVGCGSDLSDEQLTKVELWLSAHFACVQAPVTTESSFESASRKFMVGNQNLEGVLATSYGQRANMLSGGCLVDFDKRPANIFTIGSI